MDCSKIVALLTYDGGSYRATSLTTYGRIPNNEGSEARFETEATSFHSSPTLFTFCDQSTPMIGEIMRIRISSSWGGEAIDRGVYPNKPEWDYENKRGEVRTASDEFYLLNTRSGPDFWLPGVSPRAEVTPLATTYPGILSAVFTAWIGDRAAIQQWVRNNSISSEVKTGPSPNIFGGQNSSYTATYQGWRIACSFPYEALLAYPFCGGVIRGRESEGPQFVNLCKDDLGFCNEPKCCDCCDIARSVLAIFGEPIAA